MVNEELARTLAASCDEPLIVLDNERRVVAMTAGARNAIGELLAQAAPRFDTAESARRGVARRHDPPLAVEDNHRLFAAPGDGSGAFLVHHSFTIELPFSNPVEPGRDR